MCGLTFLFSLKGEELRKLIGAPAYIECSSKTQQVCILCSFFYAYLWNHIYAPLIDWSHVFF